MVGCSQVSIPPDLVANTLAQSRCNQAALPPIRAGQSVDTERLRQLLDRAKQAGLRRPSVPKWAIGSGLENELPSGRFVSTEKSIEDELLGFLRSQSSLEVFNDKMLNQGNSWMQVSHRELLQWLLYVVSVRGTEAAIDSLHRFLLADHVPALQVLAVAGVEVEQPVELGADLRLVPFSLVPRSRAGDALDPPLLKPENSVRLGLHFPLVHVIRQRCPTAAIIRNVKLRPKAFGKEDVVRGVIDFALLYRACACLTLVGQAAPLPIADWFVLEDWVPCANFFGSGWGAPVHDVINVFPFKLSLEQAQEASAICKQLEAASRGLWDKLWVPIQRLNQARRREDTVDKAIDLGVSFEALYLNDESPNDQISFTFRLRAAWHLGATKEERKDLIAFFGKVYECRSKAVHTGRLDNKVKLKGKDKIPTDAFLKEADALCAKAIKKIVQAGAFPNWGDLILGG